MPSEAARIKKLEKQLAKMTQEHKKLLKCCKQVERWIKTGPQNQVAWSAEVTTMIRQIDWALLRTVFGGGGGTNPPQTPPAWPPA